MKIVGKEKSTGHHSHSWQVLSGIETRELSTAVMLPETLIFLILFDLMTYAGFSYSI